MASEQRNDVGNLPSLLERYNGKGASSAGFPIDGKELRVGLSRCSPLADAQCGSAMREGRRRGPVQPTLIKLVSQAFLLMRRLS